MAADKEKRELVDPIERLAMSLSWVDDYSLEYRRRLLVEAFVAAYRETIYKEIQF